MDNRFKKTLLAITTYNQLEYTKQCIGSIKKLDEVPFDIIIIDDCSSDGTVQWCKDNEIQIADKHKPMGAVHSWNVAYKFFKHNKQYKYLIISNNDVLIPQGAILELLKVASRWPFSVVAPLSTTVGAGHNGNVQGIEKMYQNINHDFVNDPRNYQAVQDQILTIKRKMLKSNNVFMLDPCRVKMFNGFFFLMTRKVIDYEREDGFLFDPEKIMYKCEDEFNWSKLIPHNDFPAVCKTSFIFHFKGMSTKKYGFSEVGNDKEKWKKLREESENDQS